MLTPGTLCGAAGLRLGHPARLLSHIRLTR